MFVLVAFLVAIDLGYSLFLLLEMVCVNFENMVIFGQEATLPESLLVLCYHREKVCSHKQF